MATIQFHSKWKTLFRLSLVLFFVLLVGYISLLVAKFLVNKNISDKQVTFDQQMTDLKSYESLSGFNKLMAVKELENTSQEMPWSKHIQKIFDMLADLQKVNYNQWETIVLSDFNVTLDKISLKGRVSNLALLYYTSSQGNYTSLIDRFTQLDFVKDIKIKSYTKAGDYYQFTLDANVVNDGK